MSYRVYVPDDYEDKLLDLIQTKKWTATFWPFHYLKTKDPEYNQAQFDLVIAEEDILLVKLLMPCTIVQTP